MLLVSLVTMDLPPLQDLRDQLMFGAIPWGMYLFWTTTTMRFVKWISRVPSRPLLAEELIPRQN